MVQKKVKPGDKNWLARSLERIDRDHPVVAERWFVYEVTPSRRYSRGDGHGGSDWDWTDVVKVRVSDYYNTKKEAEKFISEHEPDEGKTLEIFHDTCRRTITDRWSSEYRW